MDTEGLTRNIAEINADISIQTTIKQKNKFVAESTKLKSLILLKLSTGADFVRKYALEYNG